MGRPMAGGSALAVDASGLAVPCFVADRLGLYVRVGSDIPKCVAFVGVESGGGFVSLGTAFVAGVRRENFDIYFLVMSNHVVENIKAENISVRMNRKTGDASTFLLPKASKVADVDNDIAVMPLAPIHDTYDFKAVLLDRADHNQSMRRLWQPGLGD